MNLTPLPDPPAPAAAPALREVHSLPGPRRLPWLGNALQVDGPRLHQQMEQWSRDFGPFYQLRIGPQTLLVVADHSVVARVLRDRPDGFRRTVRLERLWLDMKLPPGVFGAHGADWQRQRRMVMAAFDPGHVRQYVPSLVQVAQRLAGRWQAAAQTGAHIDLQADLMRYTVDTIAGLAFGTPVNTLESDGNVIQQHLDKIFPALFNRLLKPVPMWRYVRSKADRELDRAVVEVLAAVNGFTAQARQRLADEPDRRAHPHNLLEAMLVAADAPEAPDAPGDTGGRITDDVIAGNVLTMLLAGEDTTANTLAWMVWLLWSNPPALARATAEVRRVCGNAAGPAHAQTGPPTFAPTFEQIAQLDYVEACAHETMRLKPVAPTLPLQALRDTTLGDVHVREGQVVLSLLRRDSVSDDHVPRAAAFEPERWLQEGSTSTNTGSGTSSSTSSGTGGTAGTAGTAGTGGIPGQAANAAASSARRISMPFGAGPRICPGRYLALLEMKMAMATLLGCFDITSVDTADGLPPREHLAFTMAPVGLRMRLRPRQLVSSIDADADTAADADADADADAGAGANAMAA